MKKYFAISLLILTFAYNAKAQTRGIKIGYIDMEYILQNVPDYAEAKNQLEQKANKWKQDIEAKKVEIAKLKDALKTERALLTKELIDEREEEIKFQEDELLDFQQKKFGPNGDLITQKAVLVKPIQDQVFSAVQDIAEIKKYDFIFDKSSDLTMLFTAKRHDISDQVLRSITRAEKRQQLSSKQLKAEEAKDYEENLEDENPALAARRKVLEEKKAAREKLAADRKEMMEQKKLEQEEKRNALKSGKKTDTPKTATDTTQTENTAKETKAAERARILEERKNAADAKRKAQIEAKEAAKTGTVPVKEKATQEKGLPENAKSKSDTIKAPDNSNQAKAAARAKIIEDRKKLLEEKRKKMIEDREAAKKTKQQKIDTTKTN